MARLALVPVSCALIASAGVALAILGSRPSGPPPPLFPPGSDEAYMRMVDLMPMPHELRDPAKIKDVNATAAEFARLPFPRILSLYERMRGRAHDVGTVDERLGTLNRLLFAIPDRYTGVLEFKNGELIGSRADESFPAFDEDGAFHAKDYHERFGFRPKWGRAKQG